MLFAQIVRPRFSANRQWPNHDTRVSVDIREGTCCGRPTVGFVTGSKHALQSITPLYNVLMNARLRRDRRGRSNARLLLRSAVPARISRRERFERIAVSVMNKVRARAQGELDKVRLTVDYVPPLSADLSHVFEATRHMPATIVVYYIPLSRLDSDWDELLGEVVSEQAALLCSCSADELRP